MSIGAKDPAVYGQVAGDTLRPERMAEMAPRDVSGVAWAFAKASCCIISTIIIIITICYCHHYHYYYYH